MAADGTTNLRFSKEAYGLSFLFVLYSCPASLLLMSQCFSESPLLASTQRTPMIFLPFIRCTARGTLVYPFIFVKNVISTSLAFLTSSGSRSIPLTPSCAHCFPSASACFSSFCFSRSQTS